MPTIATFQFIADYRYVPFAMEWVPFDGSTTLRDTADGTPDGRTAVGGTVTADAYPDMTFTVHTAYADGAVIIENGLLRLLYYNDWNFAYDDWLETNDSLDAFHYCFAAGTRIATERGERPVETLLPGDKVLTAGGGLVPVHWLGRQTIAPHARGRRGLVNIPEGAFGAGLPARSLRVTGDHAVHLDGCLVNAAALVGLAGIDWLPEARTPDPLTVYHVETEAHELLLAEGVACESFIDYAGREGFDNHDAYVARYGSDRLIRELCLPRVTTARALPASLRHRLTGAAPQRDAA